MKKFCLLLAWVLVLLVSCTPLAPEGVPGTNRSALTTLTVPADITAGTFGTDVASAQTVGESFVAPAVDTVLQSMVVPLNLPATVVFHAYVYSWDPVNLVAGAPLYDSGPITPAGGLQSFTFAPNLTLSANADYIAFISCSEDIGSSSGDGSFFTSTDDTAYGSGHGWRLSNGGATGAWTAPPWDAVGADFAVTATFVAPPSVTTTTVAAVPSSSVSGQSVTFTATVAPPGATGQVTFKDGGTTIGTATLSGSSASISLSSLGVLTHSITAEYPGDAGNVGSTSSPLSFVVSKADTTTTIASSPNPSTAGATVTFVVTVGAVAPGAGTPTGTVTFKEGSTTLGITTLSSGSGSFQTSGLGTGLHSITAEYAGEARFNGSTGGPLTHSVNQDTATISVSASPEPSTFGGTVTFTATVTTGSSGGTPTGTVTFHEGATPFGTATLSGGVATVVASSLAGGSHSITADYNGDATHATVSATLVHNVTKAATTTSVASGTNPSVFGQTVTFSATVTSGQGTPTGQVVLKDGVATLATLSLTNGSATLSVSSLSVGTHSITAEYQADSNFAASTSGAVGQLVNLATTTTSLASSSNPSLIGSALVITATVGVDFPGTGAPSGTVTFTDGGVTIGSSNLLNGVAQLTTSALTVGTHTIVGTYAGAASFAGSTSPALMQVVNPGGVAVALASSLNPSTLGTAVTFTATVNATGGGPPTGTVTFLEGTTVLGTGALSGAATTTFTTSALSGGLHSITARYEGDASHSGGSTATLVQTVNPAATTTALSSSINPSAFGQSVTLTASVTSLANGTRTGTVTFRDGGFALAVVALDSSGGAQLVTWLLAVGSHALTAVYSGDSNFAASTSPTVSQMVDKSATTTALVSSSSPSLLGTSVTFTATVRATAPGAGVPSGTVAFREGASTLGTGTLSGAGVATFATALLGAGSHTITADYGGSVEFLGSLATFSQVVNTQAATIALSSAPNPSGFGAPVTFTATVTGGAGTPVGTVFFTEGATILGSDVPLTSGVAKFTTTKLNSGAQTVTAHYSGDSIYATGTGSVSHVVGKAPTSTTVKSSLNPTTLGAAVTFTATVSSVSEGITGQVSFHDGATLLGMATLASSVASLTTTTLASGGHTITVTYAGTTNFAGSTSLPLAQSVILSADGGPNGASSGGSDPSSSAGANPNARLGGDGCSWRVPSTSWPDGGLLVVAGGALAVCLRRRARRPPQPPRAAHTSSGLRRESSRFRPMASTE